MISLDSPVQSRAIELPRSEVTLELFEWGAGEPLVVLHGASGIDAGDAVNRLLADGRRVIAASHPGFGRSSLPDWMDSVDDLVYVYLELIEALGLDRVTLVGFSFGGWIAAELAVRAPSWLVRLVLVDAVGIRVGSRTERDIVDVWAHDADTLAGLLFHDHEQGKRRFDVAGKPTAELEIIARNQEALVRFAWEPYMHNPKLRRRLRGVTVPTLVLWGASDRIVTPAYGRAYAESIPGAEFQLIEVAGHLPQLEQPARVADAVRRFIASSSGPSA